MGEPGGRQRDAAQRREQHVGHRGEPQAELVRAHRPGRGAVGEQVELALLDPVLHLAAGAVEPLVERLRAQAAGLSEVTTKRGLALVSPLPPGQLLGLADHPARAAPAVQGLVAEILEAACRRAGLLGLGLGRRELGRDFLHQARIAGEAEDVIDPVLLAPDHQRLAGEARIGAQNDPHLRPAGADLRHQPRDLLDRAGAGVDVRPAQLGHQQMVAAEDVERQVAVAAIVAVEEPALLGAVQRIVGGVEVEHDLLGWRRVRVEEQLDEQPLDRGPVMADLVVARRLARRRVLEPVERRLAGQGCAIRRDGR